jgi:phage gpG-like protein
MVMKISAYIAKLAKLESNSWLDSLKREVGEEWRKDLSSEFASTTDPYGNAWTPTKNRPNPILDSTGKLKNSFVATSTATGVRMSSDVIYAAAQNYGRQAINLPARRVLPTNGLSEKLKGTCNRAFDKYVLGALR